MSHMVMFRTAEGKPGYHHTESLDEAIRFVEHLRNQEQVADTRIFRMQEVPIEVRTYYKVEVSPTPSTPAAAGVASPDGPSASGATATGATATGATATAASAPAPVSPSAGATTKASASPVEEPIVVEPMAPGNGVSGTRFGRFNRS